VACGGSGDNASPLAARPTHTPMEEGVFWKNLARRNLEQIAPWARGGRVRSCCWLPTGFFLYIFFVLFSWSVLLSSFLPLFLTSSLNFPFVFDAGGFLVELLFSDG
jgi:hypothetical protein